MRIFLRKISPVALAVPLLASTSCMKWDYGEEEIFQASGRGLFILCEGNFQYGNATLSYYNPEDNRIENEVFYRANAMKLGDVAQSMTIHDGRGWIVVNNSHVIFAIDPETFREVGRIENLTSPRYIHFVNSEKAYVSQIWDNRIFIVNPKEYSVTGYIDVPGMEPGSGSTEQMVGDGRYVYCNCWSYQNRIIKIDTQTDSVVGSLTIGIQPNSLAADRKGRLWTITDGGYDGSPYGFEAPGLYCIDTHTFAIEKEYTFTLGQAPSELQTDASGTRLYWINDGIWSMDIDAERLPAFPLIESRDTKYYGLTIDPETDEIYVADAIDYQQPGMIYRYTPDGTLKEQFYAGVTPGAFCWKEVKKK